METQSEHWPNLLKTVIRELIKHSSDLDLPTMSEGISLMSKLFSRLSPIFNQQDIVPTFSSNVIQSPERSLPTSPIDCNQSFFETDGIGHCIELSKTLFAQFVKFSIFGKNTKLLMMFQEETLLDFTTVMDQGKNHIKGDGMDSELLLTVTEAFQTFCQYLVKVSCFPYTGKPSGKSFYILHLYNIHPVP